MMEEIGPNQILDLLLHMQQLIATALLLYLLSHQGTQAARDFCFYPYLFRESNEEHERMTRSFLVFYQ